MRATQSSSDLSLRCIGSLLTFCRLALQSFATKMKPPLKCLTLLTMRE